MNKRNTGKSFEASIGNDSEKKNGVKLENRIRENLEEKYIRLELRDDYMFGAVMSNEKNCRKLLEIILGIRIAQLDYTEVQKTIDLSFKSKGIRLDVFVTDENGNAYTVEMQTTSERGLPKRSRYYHALTDLNLLAKGAGYRELPTNIVIFICMFDPFGDGRYIYRFRNICEDDHGLRLNDGTEKIFLNTKGFKGDASEELKSLLGYIESGTATDSYTRELAAAVYNAKRDGKRMVDYMKYELNIMDARDEGIAIGEKRGKKNFLLLYKKLAADGRLQELDCPDLDLDLLFKEYGIE